MIYVVEDDHHVRKAIELLLTSNHYECRSFKGGEDFLADTSHKSVHDILVLDMNMKGLYGREFLNQLVINKIPVTVLGITANDDEVMRSYCRELGVKALLTKPVDSHALMDLIRYHGEMHGV